MKRGLVIAGATGWRSDLAKALRFDVAWDVILGVNDVGTVLPGVDELVTVHHEGRTMGRNTPAKSWARIRAENGHPPVPVVAIASSDHWPNDVSWKVKDAAGRPAKHWHHGTSGLYGVARALFWHECDRVVLCGMPMDKRPNDFRDEKEWCRLDRYVIAWQGVLDQLIGRVRSFSGQTAEWLGVPDREWLGV